MILASQYPAAAEFINPWMQVSLWQLWTLGLPSKPDVQLSNRWWCQHEVSDLCLFTSLALPNCEFAMSLPSRGNLDTVLAQNFSEWAGCSGKQVANSTEMPNVPFGNMCWWQRYKDTRNASGGRTDSQMHFLSSVCSWNHQCFLTVDLESWPRPQLFQLSFPANTVQLWPAKRRIAMITTTLFRFKGLDLGWSSGFAGGYWKASQELMNHDKWP